MSEVLTNLVMEHPLVIGALALPVCMFLMSSLLAPSFDYKGKHVMITGGSSGIGLEVSVCVCQLFAYCLFTIFLSVVCVLPGSKGISPPWR